MTDEVNLVERYLYNITYGLPPLEGTSWIGQALEPRPLSIELSATLDGGYLIRIVDLQYTDVREKTAPVKIQHVASTVAELMAAAGWPRGVSFEWSERTASGS